MITNGEFWIIDGSVTYADGDIGDYNHEMVAVEAILSNYDIEDYDEFDRMSLDELVERGMGQEEIDAVDFNGRGDARAYAIKHFGWKRLLGREIETYTLTESDLDDIANGLYDAYGDDVINTTFNIEIQSSKRYYVAVPWEIISSKDFTTLMSHGIRE